MRGFHVFGSKVDQHVSGADQGCPGRKLIHQALRETLDDMEAAIQTRVRVDGADQDRSTGNAIGLVSSIARPGRSAGCPPLLCRRVAHRQRRFKIVLFDP
jgi:hypothetical protein